MLNSLVDDVRYHCPVAKATGFPIYKKEVCNTYMLEDLAKSGLTPDKMGAFVTTAMNLAPWSASVAYYIPYFDPFLDRVCRKDDELFMYRLRMMDGIDKKKGRPQRYTQPSRTSLVKHGYVGSTPYVLPRTMELLDSQDTLYVCEGEKKTACFIDRMDRPAIGIGGYQSWRGEGDQLHDWIPRIIKEKGVKSVVIIPDGDIYRIDICQGYGMMADRLKSLRVDVDIVAMPTDTKLDDELVARGVEGEAWFESLGKLDTSDLVQAPETLSAAYGCSLNKQGTLVCNENNYRRLLTEHPAFTGGFSLNTDTMTYMHAGEEMDLGVFENKTAAHFQHYFQMHGATPERLMKTAISICKENRKSYFLEGVPEWDGVERLETMFIDLWGVKDSAVHRELGLKFLTSAYARASNPGCKVDWMLVTTGGQGFGKTYFAEVMFYGLQVTVIGVPKDKDLEMLIHSGLCVVFEEMAAMHGSNKTREEWKGRMTQTSDSYRPPYERATVKMPRHCVFYGNTNHSDVVEADEGGNRRWAVMQVEQCLDFDKLKEVRAQLWAEAKVRYENGQEYGQISQEVMDHVSANHTAEDLLYSHIEEFLNVVWKDSNGKFFAVQLNEYLSGENIRIKRSTRELKSILTTKFGTQYKKIRVKDKVGMGYEMQVWPVVVGSGGDCG